MYVFSIYLLSLINVSCYAKMKQLCVYSDLATVKVSKSKKKEFFYACMHAFLLQKLVCTYRKKECPDVSNC